MLSTVYNYPTTAIDKLIGDNKNQILGIQANVWVERITNKSRLDYMTYPRLLAIAENAWIQPGTRNYECFILRTKVYLNYLNLLKINYFDPFDKGARPEPWGPDKQDVIAEG